MNTEKLKQFRNNHPILYHICLMILTFIGLLLIALFLIRIYTHHGREIELPDFCNQSLEDVKHNKAYDDFEFIVIDSSYQPKQKAGMIISQNPMAREAVKSGRKIYVTISVSEPPIINMPNLINLSYRQAKNILEELGLTINPVIYKASPYENAVLEQLYKGRNIAPNAKIKLGEPITLIVGKKIGDGDEDENENQSEFDTNEDTE